MNQINNCIARINAIRGVNKGIITHEQISNLIIQYQLDENQSKLLYELLKQNEIYPVSEEEFPSVHAKQPFVKVSDSSKDYVRQQPIEEDRLKYLDKIHKFVNELFEKKPHLKQKYLSEIPVLRKYIIAFKNEPSPSDILIKATKKIPHYRIEQDPELAYGYSYHMSHRFSRFEARIKVTLFNIYTSQEAEEFITRCCENNELNNNDRTILIFFLHLIPYPLTHHRNRMNYLNSLNHNCPSQN